MKRFINVIGGGLAGSEASLQLAGRGVKVKLFEMRPGTPTPAHRTPYLAELVCSNSLKSTDPSTASGLLKKELEQLGCILLDLAYKSSVEAGHALAVDREVFAKKVTLKIEEREYTKEVEVRGFDKDLKIRVGLSNELLREYNIRSNNIPVSIIGVDEEEESICVKGGYRLDSKDLQTEGSVPIKPSEIGEKAKPVQTGAIKEQIVKEKPVMKEKASTKQPTPSKKVLQTKGRRKGKQTRKIEWQGPFKIEGEFSGIFRGTVSPS